jgi:hypothetical protein
VYVHVAAHAGGCVAHAPDTHGAHHDDEHKRLAVPLGGVRPRLIQRLPVLVYRGLHGEGQAADDDLALGEV